MKTSSDASWCRCLTTFAMFAVALSPLVGASSSVKAQQHQEITDDLLPKPLDLEGSPAKIAKQLHKAFRQCDDPKLRQLQLHSERSISLFAAWENVMRRCTAVQTSLDNSELDEPEARRQYDRILANFVGFFEGRVNIVVPQWWRHSIECAEPHFESLSGRKHLYGFAHYGYDLDLVESAPGILAEPNIKVSVEEHLVRFRNADFDLTIPKTIVDDIADSQTMHSKVAICVKRNDNDSAVVVAYGALPSEPCWILLVTVDSSTIQWRQRVRLAPEHTGFLTGKGPWHAMSLEVEAKQIILFGQGPFAVYAAGFSQQDGTMLFRFFSEGWTAFD